MLTDSLLTAAEGMAPLSETLGAGRKGWVHLLPAGRFDGIDGRGPYRLEDAEAVIAESRRLSGRRQMVVDYAHATDLLPGTPAPAAGWIVGLQARANGIWGLVEWTERAAEAIRAREFRYLSPVIRHGRGDGRVSAILRASLTNVPNLTDLTALASAEEGTMQDQLRTEILAMLGLAAEADDAAILAAIRALKGEAGGEAAMQAARPDPAKWVPIGDFERAVAEANKLRQGITVHAAETRVAEDVRAGRILPWMKDWAVELCTANLPAYEKFLGGVGPGFSHLLTRTHARARPPELHSERTGGDLERTVARNLGLPEDALLKPPAAL